MTDLYLKFTDQPEALSVMTAFTYTDDDGNVQLSQGGHTFALWEVGEINGVEGWHVNLRIIDDTLDVSALEPYCVTPRNPRVVWG
jgi:hypothetical protein